MSIEIDSQEDVNNLLFNVIRFDMQYNKFIEDAARTVINEELLLPIKEEMRKFDYSQKIIDATTINNLVVTENGFLQFDVISDYTADTGFDVSTAREKGTKKHFIKPTVKLALSWLSGNIRAFSKGHWVKGITKSNIIKKTIETRFPIAQERLEQESIIFFNGMVSS